MVTFATSHCHIFVQTRVPKKFLRSGPLKTSILRALYFANRISTCLVMHCKILIACLQNGQLMSYHCRVTYSVFGCTATSHEGQNVFESIQWISKNCGCNCTFGHFWVLEFESYRKVLF